MNKYEVIVVVSGDINNKNEFEKYLKKEGFSNIENEEFAYQAFATLPLMNTRAFIFGVLKKALELSKTPTCQFICQLGENKLEKYIYDEKIKNFKEL